MPPGPVSASPSFGGGTRAGLGRPPDAGARPLSTGRLTGITLYEPSELVLSARAGTPLAEVEARLAENGQMLPFEPMDHRSLFGTGGEPTIGAVAACNISGPRRLSAGAARDHLIGVRFVNGRGQPIAAGGRVMKNVTGLDLVKLSAGAFGTLGVLTEVTFKLLPRPQTESTLVFAGLADELALALMGRAMRTPFEVSAAAHLPAGVAGERAQTLLRLEGFADSVSYRWERLGAELAEFAQAEPFAGDTATTLWTDIANAAFLSDRGYGAVLRVHVAPSRAAALVREAGFADQTHWFDWAGGLIWAGLPEGSSLDWVRRAVRAAGGHCMLVRASPAEAIQRRCVRAALGAGHEADEGHQGCFRSERRAQFRPHVQGGVSHADKLWRRPAGGPSHAGVGENPAQLRPLRLLHRDLPDLSARRR